MKRLAAEDAVVAVPVVVVEPVPVLDPAVVVSVEVRDVLGVVGVPPKICNLPSKSPPFEFSQG